jgi:hypothetical protein
MDTREYIDQIHKFVEGVVKQHKAEHQTVTNEFFKASALKENARIAIDKISDVLSWPVLTPNDFEQYFLTAVNEYTTNNAIDIIASQSLKKSKKETWLTEKRREEIPWNYSNRYFRYLKKGGRSQKVLEETKRSSVEILKKVGDPKSAKAFYVKGLVVGSVQSGKTGNFNAVINGAIDAGYGLIIVLSGIMEDLRVQTQLRIEEDVVGYGVTDIVRNLKDFKGVGTIQKFGELGDKSIPQIQNPTSHKADFKKTIKAAEFPLNFRNILVCKKNTGVLKNLILWLHEHLNDKDKHDIPLLVLDDEADNASLNNMGDKGREYASKINGHIRALLGLFTRKTYLGYTATPFANVIQDKNEVPLTKWKIDYKEKGETIVKEFDLVDNLFPEDFIELLFPPSNYIGAKHFFETRIEDIKKIDPLVPPAVTDYENAFPTKTGGEKERSSRKDDPYPQFLPESLKDAIKCFVISTAVRLSRKAAMIDSKQYVPHNTMLIHISRFTSWQTRTKSLVADYVAKLTDDLNNDLPANPNSVYGEFERTWYKYYAHVIGNIRSYLPQDYEDEFLDKKNFDTDIKPLLLQAITGVEIKAINSETGDSLVYPKNTEKKYIAIGGNRLSRGFTLEGLTINYFIRNTDYADTLLQMGRWFGYRPGYLDCCKLFTTSINIHKFDLTTVTIEELEQEFREMSKKNRTPADFILRVKSHPKVLKITRANMLKKTVTEKIDYSGDIEQSTKFSIDKTRIENAWSAFVEKVKSVKWESDDRRGFFIHKTDSKGLFAFLDLNNSFYDFELPCVKEYINLCNSKGKLINWTIAVKRNLNAGKKVVLPKEKSFLPEDMNLTIRRGPDKDAKNPRSEFIENHIFKASGKSANIVASGEDFAITLDDAQVEEARKEFLQSKIEEYMSAGATEEAAKERAGRINTIPDKAFRLQMDEKDGILVIYLIDLASVFESTAGGSDEELLQCAKDLKLDLSIPLAGYALGFPKVSGEIGGVYIRGDYTLEEPEEEDYDESLEEA